MLNNDESQPSKVSKPMKAFINAKKSRSLAKGGKYKVDKNHHFSVHVTGLLGKLPTSDDIFRTFGPHYDFMAAFQTFFLFNGEIF
jgi:hypothetical protein